MRVLNDFKCLDGHVHELYVDNELTLTVCQTCGKDATKVQNVPNFMLPGNDPSGFPTSADRWVKMREQKIAQEKKADNS